MESVCGDIVASRRKWAFASTMETDFGSNRIVHNILVHVVSEL